jgi:hypothetical protein
LTRAECSHAPQRFVQRQDVYARTRRRFITGEGDAFESAAALVGETRSRVIDQNPAHQTGSNAKEVCAVTPLDVPLIDQADVHLMYQRGWLQRVFSDFTTHLRGRDAPEVVINERDQLVERSTSPFAHCEEQFCNPGHVWQAIGHLMDPRG